MKGTPLWCFAIRSCFSHLIMTSLLSLCLISSTEVQTLLLEIFLQLKAQYGYMLNEKQKKFPFLMLEFFWFDPFLHDVVMALYMLALAPWLS